MTQRPRPRDVAALRTATPGTPDAAPARAEVRSAVLGLVDRFLAHEATEVDATWRIVVRDHGAYTLHVRERSCFVSQGKKAPADATLEADAQTWVRILTGRTDGIAAFTEGHLEVIGDLNLALRLETMFRPGSDSTRVVRTAHTNVKGVRIESMIAGFGTPVVLIHGLGASKVSFVPTFHALADRFEVHAIDLPGFGKSEKPQPFGKRYSMPWMAELVHGYLARNRIRKAYLVGNSMGGRIATEVALRYPRTVLGTIGLGPAVAFDEWQWAAPALRLVRSQWAGLAPVPLRAEWIESGVRDLFHDPDSLPIANLRAAADEFQRDFGDRGFRLALLACARSLASERAEGRHGFWTRLRDLEPPSYWIWGESDRLVSSRYADRVRSTLPDARVEVWQQVGHVPQFEVPERTNQAVIEFITDIEAQRA